MTVDNPPPRRDRARLERRYRIKTAARDVFAEKGFEAATTREIASRADIGTGTLFYYARDKHDLVLMVVNDELDRITATAFKTIPMSDGFLVQLLHIFAPRYHFWAIDPALSRHAVQQTIAVVDEGDGRAIEAVRFNGRQQVILNKLAELIVDGQRRNKTGRHVDPHTGARLVFDIYLSEMRYWLETCANPTPEDGIARLRNVLTLAIAGLQPASR